MSQTDTNTSNIFLRYEQLSAYTEKVAHSHEWGQLLLIDRGLMEVQVAGERILTPCHLTVWIPARIVHANYNQEAMGFCSINVQDPLAHLMPDCLCTLEPDPLLKAIMDDFVARHVTDITDPDDIQLAQVMLKRLGKGKRREFFLPSSRDKLLAPLLKQLERNPGDNRTLKQWAKLVHSTERTLARRFNSELHMTFNEWRQRLRYITSVSLLRSSMSVKEIALQLGYSQASPFITMFTRHARQTPEQYRRSYHLSNN